MGCKTSKKNKSNLYINELVLSYYSFENFELIANGNYGPVYKCDSKIDDKLTKSNKVVMVQYYKERVLLSRSLYSVMNELVYYKKNNFKSKFIINAKYAFQDKYSFYLIQEYVEGGDLRYHLNRHVITENKAKFLIACLIIGVEFLHKRGYVHRNLKPENLILDSNGYLKINDMKLLREASKANYFDTSGTPGYMAPEILFRQNHGCCSDIFSIGIVAYEMMFNKLPFKCETRKEYGESLMSDQDFLIKESDLPEGWSRDCADFINRCIQKRAIVRIGYNGIEELKDNRWFREYKWEELSEMKLVAPFIPKRNSHKLRVITKYEGLLNSNIKLFMEYYEITKKFEGYYYNFKTDYKKEKEESIEEDEEGIHNMNEVLMEGYDTDNKNKDN